MKIFNFEKFVFTINVVVIACVFALLIPTTQIVAKWYPDNQDVLWMIPAGVLSLCAVLWLVVSLSLPALIRIGIFEDRRHQRRDEPARASRRIWRTVIPIIVLVIQILLLLAMTMCVVAFLRSETLVELLTNLP